MQKRNRMRVTAFHSKYRIAVSALDRFVAFVVAFVFAIAITLALVAVVHP